MSSASLLPLICAVGIVILVTTITCNISNVHVTDEGECDRLREETKSYPNTSLILEPKLKYKIRNSTILVLFMDHGWVQSDWDFYLSHFRILARRLGAARKYSDIVLSANYYANNPYRSLSGIFLHVMTELNRNRTEAHLQKLNVWLHLRSPTLHLLHEERQTIPLLTNPLISETLTGLILEASILDPRKEWTWQGLSLYKKAVNSIRPVKLAILFDRYQCIYLPMRVPYQVFEDNFEVAFYRDYERLDLEQALFHLGTSNPYIPFQKKILMNRVAFEECLEWFSILTTSVKVKPIRGVFHGVEHKIFFNFTEFQLLM